MSTPNDNKLTKGLGKLSNDEKVMFRLYAEGKLPVTQPSPAAVELALAERQANSEKINATVEQARVSAIQPEQLAAQLRTAAILCPDVLRERDALQAQRDQLLAAMADIETRASYSLARPNKANNDIQMDYIKQQAQAAIARATEGGAGQ